MSADPFVREAREDVERLSEGLVALETEGADRETVDELFRHAHSLKGSLGMEGYDEASDLAHVLEDLLDAVRAGEVDPEGDLIDRGLDAVDALASTLDEVERAGEPTTDRAETVEALRAAVETARPADAASAEKTAPDADATTPEDDGSVAEEPDIDELLAEAEPGGDPDLSAEEALDAVSEFDDLDALAADVDDDEAAAYEGLEGGGSMPPVADDPADDEADRDELTAEGTAHDVADAPPDEAGETESERASGTETPEEAPEPTTEAPDAENEPGDDATAVDDTTPDQPASAEEGGVGGEDAFASVKAEVADEETSVDELEAEIEAEAFGEFDDDDEMSIEELVDIDPDEDHPTAAESSDIDAASAETTSVGAIDEEDDEAASADDAPADAESAGDPEQETSPSGGKRDEFAWVRESVEVEESIEALEAEIESEAFGEFDGDDEMSIEELIDLDPSDEPPKESELRDVAVQPEATDAPETPVPGDGTEDAESAGVATDEEAESEGMTADTEQEPEATDAPETPELEGVTADTEQEPEGDTEPAADAEPDTDAEPAATDPVGALAAELDADRSEVAAVVDDLTREDETAASLDPATVEAELAAAEEELASIAEELDAVDLGADEEVAPASAESGFERDSELEAFESRFEGLFDREPAEERGRRAVGTLAESSVDPATYRRPLDDARDDRDLGTTSDIQTLTVDVENADELLSLTEELSVHARRLSEELAARPASDPVSRALSELGATTRDLQRTVMDVRLMPLSTVTGGLGRVVRDVTRETGTEARLTVEGEDVRLDRSIIDRLGDPIVHLVRNAVGHGIEPADEREAAGKPREGTVELRARRDGSEVVVEVTDDGRGVDVDAVFERAVDHGIVAPDADLTEAETLDLLFHPGFSTAPEVTKTSGRGVGLDVVRDVAEALNGDVSVETERGEGTTIRLRLPVSVATLEVLFVEAGGERYALPVDAVEHVGREGGARIAGGGEEGLLTPELTGNTVDLAVAMGAGETTGDAAVVRVGRADGSVALRCDRVLNTRDVVISPYDDLLAEVPGLTGTTMTDDGRLVNVVDVERMDVPATTEDT